MGSEGSERSEKEKRGIGGGLISEIITSETLIHNDNEQIQGVVDIEGILRQGETSTSLMVPNNPQKNEWYTISTKEMSDFTGASTTLVELVAGMERVFFSRRLKLIETP